MAWNRTTGRDGDVLDVFEEIRRNRDSFFGGSLCVSRTTWLPWGRSAGSSAAAPPWS
jgi:hypothetical protein